MSIKQKTRQHVKKLIVGTVVGILTNITAYFFVSLFIHKTTAVDLSVDEAYKLTGATYINALHSKISFGSQNPESGNMLYGHRVNADTIYNQHFTIYDGFVGFSSDIVLSNETIVIIFLIPVILSVISSYFMLYIFDADSYYESIGIATSQAIGFIVFILTASVAFSYQLPTQISLLGVTESTLTIDPINAVIVSGIIYPVIIGILTGILYYAYKKYRPSEVASVGSKYSTQNIGRNMGLGFLTIIVIIALIFAWQAALIPIAPDFTDKNEIKMNQVSSVTYDYEGSDVEVFGVHEDIGSTSINIDDEQINETFYRTNISRIQSANSATVTISIGGAQKSYSLKRNEANISTTEQKTVGLNETYNYRLQAPSDNRRHTIHVVRFRNETFSVTVQPNGEKSLQNEDNSYNVTNITPNGMRIVFKQRGTYTLYSTISYDGTSDKPTTGYITEDVRVSAG